MDRSAYNTVIVSRRTLGTSYTIKSPIPALGSFPDCILRPANAIPDSKALYCNPLFYGVVPGFWERNGSSTYFGIVALVLLALVLNVMRKGLKSAGGGNLSEVEPEVGRRSYGLYMLSEVEDCDEESATVVEWGGGGRRSHVVARRACTEDILGWR